MSSQSTSGFPPPPSPDPLRHMLLVVVDLDEDGNPLTLENGPTLPPWAGEGEVDKGYNAGLPGKGNALKLSELWTEFSPRGAYWNPTWAVEDTRLEPFKEDFSIYRFCEPEGGA